MWPDHTGKVLGRIFTDVPEWPAMREVVAAEHRDILETIRNGEGERAATRVHAHIMKSYDWILLAGGQSRLTPTAPRGFCMEGHLIGHRERNLKLKDRIADTAQAVADRIDAAVGERTNGPLLARGDGSRLDRHTAVTVPSSG